MRLKFLWQQYKNDGRIGPLLQSQCEELVSMLEQISEAPEPSKTFQAMLDVAVAHALDLVTQLAGNSPSLTVTSVKNSSTQDDYDACTTPNMSPSPSVAKTLEWTPTANVCVRVKHSALSEKIIKTLKQHNTDSSRKALASIKGRSKQKKTSPLNCAPDVQVPPQAGEPPYRIPIVQQGVLRSPTAHARCGL